jgi:hypothetical protein
MAKMKVCEAAELSKQLRQSIKIISNILCVTTKEQMDGLTRMFNQLGCENVKHDLESLIKGAEMTASRLDTAIGATEIDV